MAHTYGSLSPEGLVSRCSRATDLLDPFDITSVCLEDVETVFAVNFEFPGSEGTRLRLEIEFRQCSGLDALEMAYSRWIKFGDHDESETPLEISILDFER